MKTYFCLAHNAYKVVGKIKYVIAAILVLPTIVNAQQLPQGIELVSTEVICDDCAPVAVENVDGVVVTYAIPDADRSTVQAYVGEAQDPINVIQSDTLLFEPGGLQIDGRFVLDRGLAGGQIERLGAVYSLDQPNTLIDLPNLSAEPGSGLAEFLQDISSSFEVALWPFGVNSNGQVVGSVNGIISGAVFDPNSGLTENASTLNADSRPFPWFPLLLSQDGNLLVGGIIDLDIEGSVPVTFDGGDFNIISPTEGFAYHVGSTVFDANTVLFREGAFLSEEGLDSYYLAESGDIGTFGNGVSILTTVSAGFIVRDRTTSECFLGDTSGNLVNVGSSCVDALIVDNLLYVLEEGSAVLRTLRLQESLAAPVFEIDSAFTVCRINNTNRVCKSDIAEEFGITTVDVRTATRLNERFNAEAIEIITSRVRGVEELRGREFILAARELREDVTIASGLSARQVDRWLNRVIIRRISRLLNNLED